MAILDSYGHSAWFFDGRTLILVVILRTWLLRLIMLANGDSISYKY